MRDYDEKVAPLEAARTMRQERAARKPSNGHATGAQPGTTDAAGQAESELPPGTSDDALALRFTERHGHELRFVAAWGRWLIWDGRRWAVDEKLRVYDMARKLCRDVLQEVLLTATGEQQKRSLQSRLGSSQTIHAVVKLASSDACHAVTVNQLDADPWLLNTPGGIVDLRNGTLRPHDPAALCTKITAATPGGDCPLFQSVLAHAQPDEAVRVYIQGFAGYAMTGSAREHILALWHGKGRNSKGTIVKTLQGALGDYAISIPAETLMESKHDRHPTEIAVLRGARFAVGSELDTGRRWNESRIKRLTGGDRISARYIAKDLFEFAPTHTLLVVANNKPGLSTVDEAIRRRMHLLPWTVTISQEEEDTELDEKLATEYGGVLAWMLAGCLEWQRMGRLAPPEAVTRATEEYLSAEDNIEQWIGECCDRSGQTKLTPAYKSYRDWCEQSGVEPAGRNTFGDLLEGHGFARSTDTRSRSPIYGGLSVKAQPTGRDRAAGMETDDF